MYGWEFSARHNEGMVRLSPKTELHDVLNVLAATRRELILTVDLAQRLRKPRNRAQKRQVVKLRAEASAQLAEQLDLEGRRAFRGPIAVELRVSLPTGRHDAALPTVVKDYLDLLKGSVIPDDALINHLLVLRETATAERATVTVRCLPQAIFAVEYDLAFRLLAEERAKTTIRDSAASPPCPSPSELIRPKQEPWGLSNFDEHARELLAYEESVLDLLEDLDTREEEQLREDPDGYVDLEIPPQHPEFDDPEARNSTREYLERSTAHARGSWLADQGFDVHDRPGSPPSWLGEVVELDVADVFRLSDDSPGCFVLQRPPERKTESGSRSWEQSVTDQIMARLHDGGWHKARFQGPLVLDIALRGQAARGTDVDNMAHRLLGSVQKAFGAARPDIVGYRSYRQEALSNDIRLRLMPAVRMGALVLAMHAARETMLAQRAERTRG